MGSTVTTSVRIVNRVHINTQAVITTLKLIFSECSDISDVASHNSEVFCIVAQEVERVIH